MVFTTRSQLKEAPGRQSLVARKAILTAVVLTVLALAGACSSSDSGGSSDSSGSGGSSPAASSTQSASAVAYAECMRKNGVANFPDPDPNGRIRVTTGGQNGLNPNSPEYKAASQKCESLRPAGMGSSNGQASQQALKYAECMRKNGVPDFPDPSNGGMIKVNKKDLDSPDYDKAAQKCHSLLPSGMNG